MTSTCTENVYRNIEVVTLAVNLVTMRYRSNFYVSYQLIGQGSKDRFIFFLNQYEQEIRQRGGL